MPMCPDLGPNTTQVILAIIALAGSGFSLWVAGAAHTKAVGASQTAVEAKQETDSIKVALNGSLKKGI